MTEEFDIKNEYKDFNLELINKKCEIGMSEAQKVGRIFDLESENAMLKMEIK